MFGIALPEFLVIVAVAIVVIGPQELPRLLYSAGKVLRNFKKVTADLQKSLDAIMHEEELEEITREANKAGGDNLQFEVDRQYELEQQRRKAERDDDA